MVLNLIFETIVNKLSSKSNNMYGGKINQIQNNQTNNTFFITFLIIILLLLLKGYIVYLIYNTLMPKLIYFYSDKSLEEIQNNFREISFGESIMLVILTNTLFS
jgi:hypothetical protein